MKKTLLHLLLIISIFYAYTADAQVMNDGRVLLQGFYWEASHDHQFDYYEYVEQLTQDMSNAGIDMIWLPPPSDAGAWEGYLPRELNNFSNTYGTLLEHQSLLNALDNVGIEAIADIVVNHRVGSTNWVDFTNPTWGTNSITADDEVWSQPEYGGVSLRGNYDTGTPYAAARDVDHTQEFVRNDIKAFLDNLKAFGYDGWRYDFVHGFSTSYIAEYNNHTQPTFSVGENWTSNKQVIQDWIDATGSAAFDFPTYYALKGAIKDGNYSYLAYEGAPSGGIGWDPRNYSTFIENHDTPDYDPDNNILNSNNVGQAYAYLLTHPGIPCVFWSHMYEWGSQVHDEIAQLIQIRKAAGIHSQSEVTIHRSEAGLYVASIAGDVKTVFLKMGYDNWGDPAAEGHAGSWALDASGTNYAIWSEKTNNDIPDDPTATTLYVQGYTHAYAWDDNLNPLLGTWPGVALTSGADNWMEVTVSAECLNIIFSNNGADQTADLNTCAATPYYYDGAWHANEPSANDDEPNDNSGSLTVKVQGYTHVYAWDDDLNPLLGAWPGSSLTPGDNSWMEASIDQECANVIFSNNGANQTADLYACNTAEYYHEGSWHSTDPTEQSEESLKVYAKGYTHVYAWDDNLNPLLGAWPGMAMNTEGGWNTATISAQCANVIFSYNGGSQTADLNTCGPESYYYQNNWYASDPLGFSSTTNGEAALPAFEESELVTYPNPLIEATNLRFHLDNEQHVQLVIHNMSGQQLTLIDQILPEGLHEYKFNRSSLPSSTLYFARLRLGNRLITKKLLIKK